MATSLKKIKGGRKYTLKEIAELELIPGITGYSAIYNLVTKKVPCADNKIGYTRKLHEETTEKSLKGEDTKPWTRINGPIIVRGSQIIRFRKINGLT